MKKNQWRDVLEAHWWAAKIWWGIEPKLFLSTAMHAVVTALSPYITLWLSSQIINELVGCRTPSVLWKWVILTVAVTGVLKLLEDGLYHWKKAVHALESDYEDKLLADKLTQMDFAAVEAPRTNDLRYTLRNFMYNNVYGFTKIHSWYFEKLIGGISSVLGAVSLTWSLFSSQAGSRLPWINNSFLTVCVILMLLGGAFLSPALMVKASGTYTKIWGHNNLFARSLNTFGVLGATRNSAADVRIYNQQNICLDMLEHYFPYHSGSPVCNLFFRDMGPKYAASSAVSSLMVGLTYVYVCLKAWAGAFPIGNIAQYAGAVTNLFTGFSDLFEAVGDMPNNAEYLFAIREYLEIPNRMYQGKLPTEKRNDRDYSIEFRDVSFRYPGSDSWALRHVNIKFQIGSRLAVVGMNGSGKTTFIKLLCRLYDPTEGQILLNGIDIRKYKYDDYLNIFSVVFQDFQLTALSLGQNVASGAKFDPQLAETCLRKAGFGDRLDTLPKGLETSLYKSLDQEGVDISGGEAQKIAIARTLYKNAPFLILDEPTSALDPIAEADIYNKFNEIAGDKTAIYISHRLSSCVFCDEIAVFHEGAVIQQGTHVQLLSEKTGKYHELWCAQAQYYTKTS